MVMGVGDYQARRNGRYNKGEKSSVNGQVWSWADLKGMKCCDNVQSQTTYPALGPHVDHKTGSENSFGAGFGRYYTINWTVQNLRDCLVRYIRPLAAGVAAGTGMRHTGHIPLPVCSRQHSIPWIPIFRAG